MQQIQCVLLNDIHSLMGEGSHFPKDVDDDNFAIACFDQNWFTLTVVPLSEQQQQQQRMLRVRLAASSAACGYAVTSRLCPILDRAMQKHMFYTRYQLFVPSPSAWIDHCAPHNVLHHANVHRDWISPSSRMMMMTTTSVQVSTCDIFLSGASQTLPYEDTITSEVQACLSTFSTLSTPPTASSSSSSPATSPLPPPPPRHHRHHHQARRMMRVFCSGGGGSGNGSGGATTAGRRRGDVNKTLSLLATSTLAVPVLSVDTLRYIHKAEYSDVLLEWTVLLELVKMRPLYARPRVVLLKIGDVFETPDHPVCVLHLHEAYNADGVHLMSNLSKQVISHTNQRAAHFLRTHLQMYPSDGMMQQTAADVVHGLLEFADDNHSGVELVDAMESARPTRTEWLAYSCAPQRISEHLLVCHEEQRKHVAAAAATVLDGDEMQTVCRWLTQMVMWDLSWTYLDIVKYHVNLFVQYGFSSMAILKIVSKQELDDAFHPCELGTVIPEEHQTKIRHAIQILQSLAQV